MILNFQAFLDVGTPLRGSGHLGSLGGYLHIHLDRGHPGRFRLRVQFPLYFFGRLLSRLFGLAPFDFGPGLELDYLAFQNVLGLLQAFLKGFGQAVDRLDVFIVRAYEFLAFLFDALVQLLGRPAIFTAAALAF